MKRLATLLLIAALSASLGDAAAATSAIGKKKRKNREENTVGTAEQPAKEHKPASAVHAAAGADTKSADEAKRTEALPVFEAELSPAQIDSLVAAWNIQLGERAFDDYYRNFVSFDDFAIPADTPAASIPDSVYMQRLQALASPVPLPYNPVVKTTIARYFNNPNGLVSRILALSKYFFPIIEDELLRENLPVELRVMPIIESALVPQAISKAGAAGLWQFMPSTGKLYGLEVNSLIDERLAPLEATRAACKYMRDLYNIYNDWTLAIAAYNCGPGNVNKAMARAGKENKTFWDIYNFLPTETRTYVPAFIAASYVCAYYKLHGVEVDASPLPIATDTVTVNRIMHLEQVASTIDIPIDMLRRLNPQYKMDIIPATNRSYALILPLQFVSRYVENEDEIFSKDSLYLKEYINPANLDKKKLERQVITYTVKKGDTLGKIASRNRVTVKELMRWNGLKNDKLRIGQKLKIEKKR